MTAELAEIQGYREQQCRGGEGQIAFQPSGFNVAVYAELTEVTPTLPFGPNRVRSGTGVRTDQIAGANRAGKVRALGQVLSFKLGGPQAAVPTWCGGRPSRELSTVGVNREAPLGIDAVNRAPGNLQPAKRILNFNAVVTDHNVRLDQESIQRQCQESRHGGGLQKSPGALVEPNDNRTGEQHSYQAPTQNLGKLRLQNNRLHANNLHTLGRID